MNELNTNENVVLLSYEAHGYYSHAEESGQLLIPESLYDEIKGELPSQVSVYELDGKHSCVDADLEVERLTIGELKYRLIDGDHDTLANIVSDFTYGSEHDVSYSELKEYHHKMASLYELVEISVTVHKDDIEKVNELLSEYKR
ncbi:hypothetical protein [Bacillus wiedmannii]|uniref:hypothetical protein n=1 Tax=Bacillus wiedmannii TaxID=1890302 RepID=UPI0007CA8C65|nr:hypothetical protein [Bacillus wiedmannii]OAK36240.1 hypothetical protein A6284_26000 [Bacillus wiedmannii]HDR7641351.1 hypothetical protein [Bacillus wiedmannii]